MTFKSHFLLVKYHLEGPKKISNVTYLTHKWYWCIKKVENILLLLQNTRKYGVLSAFLELILNEYAKEINISYVENTNWYVVIFE